MKRSTFLGWPTLEGWLSILNAALWILVVVSLDHDAGLGTGLLALALSPPLALLCMIPVLSGGAHSRDGLLLVLLTIGVNSFLWGYGLGWLRSKISSRSDRAARQRAANQCSACGYSLVANVSGICPECGTPIGRTQGVYQG